MNLSDIVDTRYATKAFEAGRTLPQATVDQLLAVLHKSPSSVNSQPWHFVVAATPEGRARMTRATADRHPYNTQKIQDASHVIALCVRTEMDAAHLAGILAAEQRDGRFADEAARAGTDKARRGFVDVHRYDLRDLQHWMTHQVYLALGGLLMAAAALGVDATPMEGIDTGPLDLELGLRERGLTSVALVSLGYRSAQDFNAALPKSRLSREEVFTFL
ncbi:oxygen-insensitive NAD(P)H-dependent nitroreductase NfsB [Cupriavidus sp. UYPR2.512]|uniref:oxygen-insensitive NAD(P)H-dependent nitroreductase NfsB n=1 Tax=Cupriavidus sp. UYPR2.512 TaxID=1080187 RepID=UPI00036BD483|nr:oxygen-insensitive NAD(P)H-dependent nitroreductase NfsB [Cupriavidus sp. UYPR2.512]UIF91353.1 oxygen-insensitive NAD(P)H-dependent nitroreductase NfsB [Cupriavidus necator]